MNIKELHTEVTAYTKTNTRVGFVDIIAYDYLVEFLSEPESYGKVIKPEISIDEVWARVIETSAPFSMEWGYEALYEYIQDWLTAQKLWSEEGEDE